VKLKIKKKQPILYIFIWNLHPLFSGNYIIKRKKLWTALPTSSYILYRQYYCLMFILCDKHITTSFPTKLVYTLIY